MIDIKVTQYPNAEPAYIEVQIGPDNHVSRKVQRFYVDEQQDFEQCDRLAGVYIDGASDAITAASHLAAAFLRPVPPRRY